ncbi:citrate synthase [Mesorhizobium albiziae]|uniref:citrate synthase (unknown stereospecificity) n=1 Tax=Neomesorhizobium albiziae TaxID=335020 RepID=A0A1I3VT31_9HYPH|nr:citryl-CoA lyase [Mesorhizobium albiziae]GLS29172.1 citryl-CoA lyase [Mesorhizobium albiziae]SFJ98395.1 citrate synthase [Mesorhizobium albiziae]
MQIGKGRRAVSSICDAQADRIEVRGRDLTSDLMGRIGFTDYFFLLLTGKEASEEQRFFLDLLLVAIAEHGLVPTVQAARMTLAANPGSLQGAVAAGILGAGPVILGTSELCGRLLMEADAKVAAGGEPDAVALALVRNIRDADGKVPGFGHPIHRPVDPRTVRILALAEERGVAGRHVVMARRIERAVAEVWGRPLVMNVSMPIAAVLLDLDFPAAVIKSIPLLARTASLLAHLAEEQKNPIGFLMAGQAEAAVAYERDEAGNA